MHFQVITTVTLHLPLPVAGSHEKAVGYVRTFGVNATGFASAAAFVEQRLSETEQEGFIAQMELQIVDENEWGEEIVASSEAMNARGIFYQSGRAFFCEGT